MEHLEVWDFLFLISSILNFVLISWEAGITIMSGKTIITKTFLLCEAYFVYTHIVYIYDTAVVQVDLVVSSLDSNCCEFRSVVRQQLQETSENLRYLGF